MQVTKAQAKALLARSTSSHVTKPRVRAGSRRTTKREASGPFHTHCHTCDECFRTAAAEDRHLTDSDHHRYVMALDGCPA